MRRLLLLTALLMIAAQSAAAATLDRVRETGAFRIGYRADAKPYSYRDSEGRPAGYIVDLCRQVARALGPGIREEYVLVAADRRFDAVRDGAVDILCDPSSITLARRERVDFSLPTYLDGAAVLSRIKNPVRTFEDLGGRRVGVLTGTTTERVLQGSLEKLGLEARVVAVRDHRSGMDLVWEGELEAYIADRGILAAMLREGGRPGFTLSKHYFSYETYGLALPRGDTEFRLLVDRTLARLYRTGEIKSILARTFGNDPLDEILSTMFLINALPE
jgi:polar amino acid transport system substrate-binding protein/glutamate/aspartate transport system substrate-binding protein